MASRVIVSSSYGRWEPEDEVAVAQAHERRAHLDDVVGGPDGLLRPLLRLAVVREDPRLHLLGIATAVPDDRHAHPDRALDLALIAPDGLAVPHEEPLLLDDGRDGPADVAGIAETGDESQRDLGPAPADEDRKVRLDRRRQVLGVLGRVACRRRRWASSRRACRA